MASGGPPPTPISPVTEAVVDCIGRENTVLTGIGPMSMDSSFIQLLELDQSFEKELDPVQEGVRCPFPTSQVGQSSSSAAAAASASLSAAASISTTSLEVLEREKFLLEIEVLKLQKTYLQSKLRKLEE
ncbi:uncharacterized protein LOC124277322 [Haliotis rubra]|uniref:uncharacterized protein LOC124277322 n=1 Tax=Haliotis rubra TaxID=36100 RepID=UPI001EE601F5|nr:uncharacterized protein LOC124277322 [Haliotis rubra]